MRLQKIIKNIFRVDDRVIKNFHKLYYDSLDRTWNNTYWFSIPVEKCPLDLWIYQEIVCKLRPDIIIETGTAQGGSALFLASLCDLSGKGRVISIDIIEKANRPAHNRLTYLLGSSISDGITANLREAIKGSGTIMVILDSDHRKEHVLNELRIYSEFVTKGSYLIVEDTNVNGHPVSPNYGAGPMEAVREFLKERRDFIIDRTREKFYLTFNPDGYLKRIG